MIDVMSVVLTFSVLTIIIACMGLFGLASFSIDQRKKEIGIRKAMGASSGGISIMLINDFLRWVILANIFAWPCAYLILNRWLQNYAYRTDISIGIFLFSGFLTLLIAFLTVSYQSIRASVANPVDSLRYE